MIEPLDTSMRKIVTFDQNTISGPNTYYCRIVKNISLKKTISYSNILPPSSSEHNFWNLYIARNVHNHLDVQMVAALVTSPSLSQHHYLYRILNFHKSWHQLEGSYKKILTRYHRKLSPKLVGS